MINVCIATDVYDFEKNKVGVAQYVKRLINTMKKVIEKEKVDLNIYLIHYFKYEDNLYKGTKEIICPLLPFIPRKAFTILFKAPKLLDKYNIDVFHLPAPNPLENFYFLLKGKFKKILTVHDLYLFFSFLRTKYPLPNPLKFLHDISWKPSLAMIKDKVDLFIAVSNNTKKDLIRLLKIPEEKIRVVYEAQAEIFKPLKIKNNPIGQPYILTNTLTQEIIIAYYKLKKMGVDHKLVYFGKNTWRSIPRNIKDIINKYNLYKDILILGYVPEQELVRLYNCADIFIRPSYYEGFGLPVLEAMACGCPVIASNVGSLPEIVGKNGILLNPYDTNAWAYAMYTLVTDRMLRKKLSRAGINRAKEFSWEKTAKETIKCYEELANNI